MQLVKVQIIACVVILITAAGAALANYEAAFPALQKGDYASAIPLLNAAAEKNDHRALNALAILNLQGTGLPKDEVKALMLFEKAASMGNTRSMNAMSSIYGQGTATTAKDLQKAREWAWKSSIANDPDGQFNYSQLAVQNELGKIDSTGRVSQDKYMALARRSLSERDLDSKSYTMLSRSAEQGHLAASLISIALLGDNVSPLNGQKILDAIEKLPNTNLQSTFAQMIQRSKQSYSLLKTLGQTYTSATLFRDVMPTALFGGMIKAKHSPTSCEAKNMRVTKIKIGRDLSGEIYLPISANLLKDAILIQGNWQEVWTLDICGTQVDVPLEFQADGGGGAYFQSAQTAPR